MSLLHFLPRADDFSRTKSALFKDLIAGVTVAIVALPLALGFGITSDVSAKARAVAAPIPLLAPVTIAHSLWLMPKP